MDPITIVTGCMGRLEFLKESLPTWIELTPWPIVVVDYSCPEGTGKWAAQCGPRVSVTHKEAEVRGGRRLYNPSKAHNAGIAAVKEGYLLFLDADTRLTPGFAPWILDNLEPGVMCIGLEEVNGRPRVFGILAVHRDPVLKLGAYDEGFEGWGLEDIDLYVRLYLQGIKHRFIPSNLMRPIVHSNEIRTKNYAEKNPRTSGAQNQARLERKLLVETGRSYSDWLRDPEFRAFLRPR